MSKRAQWRSEGTGVGRPGAKCTNGPKPKTIQVSSSLAKSEYFPLRLAKYGYMDTRGVPLRLAKSGADPGFRCGGKVMAWRDTPTPSIVSSPDPLTQQRMDYITATRKWMHIRLGTRLPPARVYGRCKLPHRQWRRKEIIVGGALRVMPRGGSGRGAPLPPS